MPSPEESIANALLRTLEQASLTGVDIAWPNVNYTPRDGVMYVRPDLLPGENVNDGLADGSTTQFVGLFQISIMAPMGRGIIPAMTLAGEIADLYERDAVIAAGGITVHIQGRPSVAGYIQEPERLRVPVRVRYYALG